MFVVSTVCHRVERAPVDRPLGAHVVGGKKRQEEECLGGCVLCWRWKGGPGRCLVVRLPGGRAGWSSDEEEPSLQRPPAGKHQAQAVMTAEPEVERF